jgi:hypothetical protein
MKIGVVSDTHVPQVAGRLPASLLRSLEGCDLIIHAGDITLPDVLSDLETVAPVAAVRGNMDGSLPELPISRLLNCDGRTVAVMHGHGAPDEVPRIVLSAFPAVDIIVFGHSHRALCRRRGTTLLFNPGSPTDPRFSPRLTFGILEIGDTVEGRIMDLP